MNLEVNLGDGSISGRRAAWQKQPRYIKSTHRLCRAARQRCIQFTAREHSGGAVVMTPTRSIAVYGIDGGMIQNILPYRPFPSDPQWESALRHRQHARYMAMAAFARQSRAFDSARYWLKIAKLERTAC